MKLYAIRDKETGALADEWTFCPNCGRRLTDD
jgi:ribosomal protein S27AE